MQNRKLITALLAGGLALATTSPRAQGVEGTWPLKSQPQSAGDQQNLKEAESLGTPTPASNLKAKSIIGLTVNSDSGQRLGKVQDLIVNLESHSVPFAIIEYGGALGVGATHVAVPLSDLKYSAESRELTMTASKEQFDAASPTPTGGWMAVAGQDWMKNVDRFYGQPSAISPSRYERQESLQPGEGREPVRNPVEEKGATSLLPQVPNTDTGMKDLAAHPSDETLLTKVNDLIHQQLGERASKLHATIKNGVVTLKGEIPTGDEKQTLESQIKAIPGVTGVEDEKTPSKE